MTKNSIVATLQGRFRKIYVGLESNDFDSGMRIIYLQPNLLQKVIQISYHYELIIKDWELI